MKIRDQHLLKLNSKPVQFPHYGLYERQDYETINTTPLKPDMHDSAPLVETPREIIKKRIRIRTRENDIFWKTACKARIHWN